MSKLLSLPLLALMPATALALAAPEGSSQEVEELLRGRLTAIESSSEEQLWEEAAVLADLALDFEAAEMDGALDALLSSDEEIGERGLLLLVATRLSGEEPDFDLLAGRLCGLVSSEEPMIVQSAAGLLADARFNQASSEVTEETLRVLLAGARDLNRDPQTRIELAVTAWKRGGGREKRDARTEMRAFLESSDPRLRSLAALALARTGDLETPRVELMRISLLPGAAGRLAESYLKAEGDQRYYEGKMLKLRVRLQDVLDDQQPEDLQRIEALIDLVQNRHVEGDQVDRDELIEAALDGLLQSLDAHSRYLGSETFTKFQQDLEGEYGGIGAYVEEDPTDRVFTITRPIYSGPAYKAHLRSGDKIVRIDDWPTYENGASKRTDDIIKRLKGKPGTAVKLYIWRRGMDPKLISRPTEDMLVEVLRGLITIPPMRADMLPGDIGLVELTTFSGVAGQELSAILEEMQAQGVKGIIFDLRNNSGGLLDQAQAVSDLFLPPGKLVVTTEERLEEPHHLRTRHAAILPADMPVVVLVNRFSASASEIVAGALQDHGRARLVGERSYGKGTVQHLIKLGQDDLHDDENGNGRWDNWERIINDHDEDGVFDFAPRAKLTVARWRIPSGKSIHREYDEEGNLISLGGVLPEFEVEQRRWDAWRLELMFALRNEGKIREWVLEQWPVHRDLFQELAYGDGKDPDRYPGFGEFYASLNTILPREDVRYLVRAEVRRLVQDERGAAFPQGDYQEDVQLQKAIEVLFEDLGRSPYELEPYLLSFRKLRGDASLSGGGGLTLGEEPEERREVRDALAILARARRGELELTGENLEQLRELLSKLDQ